MATKFEKLIHRPDPTKGWAKQAKEAPLNLRPDRWKYIPAMKIVFGEKIQFIRYDGKVISSHHNDAKVITNEVIHIGGMICRDDSASRNDEIQSYG